jgi:type I restriction enzyme M protein
MGRRQKIAAIKQATRAFNREEFPAVTLDCHNILRDVHKMEPGAPLTKLSKILFIKMYIERHGQLGQISLPNILDKRATTVWIRPISHGRTV